MTWLFVLLIINGGVIYTVLTNDSQKPQPRQEEDEMTNLMKMVSLGDNNKRNWALYNTS